MALLTQPDNLKTAQPFAETQPVQWGRLSKGLLAEIYPLKKINRDGGTFDFERAGASVFALLTEGQIEFSNNYTTPFESSNPESRLPNLMGMIQSGQLISAFGQIFGGDKTQGFLDLINLSGLVEQGGDLLQSLEGSSNLTKVNSTEIYVSTSPLKMPLTFVLRAWQDAKTEVEDPIARLESWTLPEYLYDQGLLVSLANSAGSVTEQFQSLWPSKVPPFVAIQYAGRTYKPLLIETISSPLVVERDPDLNRLFAQVTLSVTSRTALDAPTWAGMR